MARTTAQSADAAFKKSILNVAAVHNTADFPFYASPRSNTVVFASNIIAEDTKIPTVAPTSPTAGDMFDENGDITTDSELAVIQYNESVMQPWAGTSNNSYYLSSYDGIIIPFNFSDGSYSPQFKANSSTGENIPFGLNSWVFDYMSGVMTFYDGKPSSITNNQVFVAYWTYVGPTGVGTGGAEISTISFSISDLTSAPTGISWNSTNEIVTVTHNLDTAAPNVFISVNSKTLLTDLTIIDSNSFSFELAGDLNKTNNTVSYPEPVNIVVRKL